MDLATSKVQTPRTDYDYLIKLLALGENKLIHHALIICFNTFFYTGNAGVGKSSKYLCYIFKGRIATTLPIFPRLSASVH